MSEWMKYRLGDIAITSDFVANGSFASLKENVKYLDTENYAILIRLYDFHNKWKGPFVYIDECSYNFLKKSFVEPGDLIIANVGANAGESFLAPTLNKKMTLGPNSVLIKGENCKYLYYYFNSVYGKWQLDSILTGSAQPKFNKTDLRNLVVELPGINTQSKIVEILSSLDDKIELNNKINHELESLAQLLFKRWFVDFEFPNENGEPYKSSGGEMEDSELGEIPKGWKLDKLEKIVTKSHTGADAITRAPIVDYDTGIKCARVGDLTNKRSYLNWAFCKINPQDYERHKLEEGDIIVTRTATLGINQLVRKSIDAVCNNGLIRLKLDKKICHPNFVYIQLQSDSYKEYIERISGDSSTRPNMQMDYLLDFKIILPESSLVIKFSELLNDTYNQIDACKLENEALANTRDTLLPMLISGELQIKEN